MKKLLIILALLYANTQAQIWVMPTVAGNGSNDSVFVSFCAFDTTMYPTIADADSIIALRFAPSNILIDSLTQSSERLLHPRTGWYELAFRAANSAGDLGIYQFYVRVKIGGAWRGAASASYQVIGDDVGDYFAAIAASTNSTGDGAFACTLYVCESDGTTAVGAAFVRVLNSDESATIASGRSDANGRLILSLDASQYHIYASMFGYIADGLPMLSNVTAAGANDTIFLERFDPGNAPQASLCRVYGYVQTLGGQGIEGVVVTARIQKSPLLLDGAVISPFALSTVSDADGYWFLDLIPNSALEPDDTKYDLTLQYPSGIILRKQITVPAATNYWLR